MSRQRKNEFWGSVLIIVGALVVAAMTVWYLSIRAGG